MAAGEAQLFSPIVKAIQEAEAGTTGEIHVHLTRRFWERDPYARARRLFARFGLERTRERNAVILYVNLRRRRFAVHGDVGIHAKVGQRFWEELARRLSEELHQTFNENAIAAAVRRLGAALTEHFPAGPEGNPNELPDAVTRD